MIDWSMRSRMPATRPAVGRKRSTAGDHEPAVHRDADGDHDDPEERGQERRSQGLEERGQARAFEHVNDRADHNGDGKRHDRV
jgi:hypothetical protein